MKVLRGTIVVIIGFVVLYLLVEGIEFAIVKLASGKSLTYLSQNPDEYFSIRNRPWILGMKIIYSFVAAISSGVLVSLLAPRTNRTYTFVFTLLQLFALIWAGFISDLSTTGPTWMWISLIVVIPVGIYLGDFLRGLWRSYSNH